MGGLSLRMPDAHGLPFPSPENQGRYHRCTTRVMEQRHGIDPVLLPAAAVRTPLAVHHSALGGPYDRAADGQTTRAWMQAGKRQPVMPSSAWTPDGISCVSSISHSKMTRYGSSQRGKRPGRNVQTMQSEQLKKRLNTQRPMTTISMRLPVDVLEDLQRMAPLRGFAGYQPLVRAYVGQGVAERPRTP